MVKVVTAHYRYAIRIPTTMYMYYTHCTYYMYMHTPTHQHVLELDVSVQQPLAVQEADPLHHVQSNLHAAAEVQPHLERGVEVAGKAWHYEEDHGVGTVGIVVVDQSTNQVDYTVVLRECPKGWGGGEGGEGVEVRVCMCVAYTKNTL